MHKSTGDNRYVDETKMSAKKNQCKVTANKDNMVYIDSASDTVGIGGDAWVIEEVINRTVTIAGYDNHRKIQDKTRIGNGVTAKTPPDGETVIIRVFEATLLGEKANTLIFILQLRKKMVAIDDRPRRHGGNHYLIGMVLLFR